MEHKDLESYDKSKLYCSFCRNPMEGNDLNVRPYEGDFISIMCDGCSARFEQYPMLGPKFVVCLCSDIPRELELSMANTEIAAAKAEPEPAPAETVSVEPTSTPSKSTKKSSAKDG